MKSNAKSKTIILLTIGILFALSPIINNNFNFNGGNIVDFPLDKDDLKISAVSEKIHIDNNWTAAWSAGICTGNGTYSEPYVIEDLVIDGEGSGSCILIENSDVYFKIENCTTYNSGGSSNDAGILLSNVTKAQITDNDCFSNNKGIHLRISRNNNISRNTASNTNNIGIYLYASYYNNVSGNTANNNDNSGIGLASGSDNIISGNTANNNVYYGLYFYSSNNNISGNIASYNSFGGIYLESCYNNNISGNIMNNCGLVIQGGIYPSDFDSHHIDFTNMVNGKPLYYYSNEENLEPANFTNAGQVILADCTDSSISNLNISDTSYAISLYFCNRINISASNVSSNSRGIHIYYGSHSNITGNTANDNLYGIYLSDSNNNNIIGNTATNNGDTGIWLYSDSAYNTISGNTVNGNSIGIWVRDRSNNNSIMGNIANNNYIGITLVSSHNNIISGNTANNNFYNGIELSSSDNNNISRNTSNYNQIGIDLYSSDVNSISGNILLGNDKCIVEENCQGNTFSDNGACTYGQDEDGVIHGYNLFFLIGILSVVVIIISKKLKKI